MTRDDACEAKKVILRLRLTESGCYQKPAICNSRTPARYDSVRVKGKSMPSGQVAGLDESARLATCSLPDPLSPSLPQYDNHEPKLFDATVDSYQT